MANHEVELQRALVAAIKTAASVGGRVYDSVPRANGQVTATFPFISLGGAQETPVDEECFDRTETVHEINVWSRAPGFPECKAIAAEIRAVLHELPLTVTDNVLDRMHVLSIDYLRDPDGITSRARIVLQTDTQPA